MAKFKHGLFGCFDNIGLSIIAFCVPCYTFAKNAEAVGENFILCFLVSCIPVLDFVAMVSVRGKIRSSRNIEGTILADIFVVVCCTLCALIQESQEVAEPGPQSIARS